MSVPNVSLPIVFEERAQLTRLGVKPASIRFSGVTLESERWVCVLEKLEREASDGVAEVVMVDLQNDGEGRPPMRRRLKAEMASLSPSGAVLAAWTRDRQVTRLELWDQEVKLRLKTYSLSCEVLFWKWVSSCTLALVSLNSVFHWSVEGDSNPVKIFDRLPSMAPFQVVDYKTDPSLEWLVLVGLSAERDRVVGKLQLYSTKRACSQLIDGHSACFAVQDETTLLCFTTMSPQQQQIKLQVVEVSPHKSSNKPQVKRCGDVFFPREAVGDFPVAMQAGTKEGVLYLLTKFGYIHIYDLESVACLYANRISADTVFATTPRRSTGGIVGVNRKGQVLSVSLNRETVVRYIADVLQNSDLAVRFAARNNLPGAESYFVDRFNALFGKGEYTEAAKVAAIAPNDILRTQQIMQKFQQAKSTPGQISPILQFFGTLLDHGQLNKHESIELCRPVLLQNRKELLEKWLTQNKLDCSEELGDLTKNVDRNLALSIYLRASIPNKVVECFAENAQFEKIFHYSEKVNYTPDYLSLLRLIVSSNPKGGLEFAKLLLKEGRAVIDLNDLNQIVNLFTERSLIQECTAFLLEALENNNPSEGCLQTKLLEINLAFAPQVADAILGNRMFTFYDKQHIGELCEKVGMFKRALEHYSNIDDIKRVLVKMDCLDVDWIVAYFGNLGVEDSFQCLKVLMNNKTQASFNLCLQVTIKYHKQLTVNKIVELFESHKCTEWLFCFLGSVINDCPDKDIHFKYIKAACELGQMGVVESVCKNSNNYCPEEVKNYLKEAKLSDYIPLVIVCDRFNFIHDLIFFLYTNSLKKYIECYVKNVNSSRFPAVLGELLDLNCPEEYLKHLLVEVKGVFSTEELVSEVEMRNRMHLILPWLEDRIKNGCVEVAAHTALAKIYVNNKINPEKFLQDNNFYDSAVIGKYCETRNPQLACIAYEKGGRDLELVNVYKDNSMFKQAAKFVVRQKKPELWSALLKEDDAFRKSLIYQVIHSCLPESQDPSEVSETIKAFMAAQLLNELVSLLDKLIAENSIFSEEPDIQNLIILTAMKVDKPKVLDFVERFSNYSAEEIANVAVNSGLYNEALVIYKKFNMNDAAINVLLKYKDDVDEGIQYAEHCGESTVWTILGQTQLHRGLVKDAIESFIKAKNPCYCEETVKAAESVGEWEDLLRYLQMAAQLLRNTYTESELVYVLAKTGSLRELEEFVSAPNNVDMNGIGVRCFQEKLYVAAKILYNNSSNFSSLAMTLVCLKDFQSAVESARKANKIQTWKYVCFACLEEKEFRFAQMCALHILVDAEEVEDLVSYYEERGYFDEIISVLEVGQVQERAHMGIFTQLAVLYARHKPHRMREHLELYWSKMNIPKVLRATEAAHLWQELVFLYEKYEFYDNALDVMMEHPTEAWKEGLFKDMILKVSNHQLYMIAVQFYLEFKPQHLNDFLITLSPKADNTKIVEYLKSVDRLEMVKPYLKSVQYLNDCTVNEGLNDLLIAEEDYEGLRTSVEKFENFDILGTARRLEESHLMEFRRIAAELYRKSGRWKESLELCKKNSLLEDAIDTAARSGRAELAKSLAEWFLSTGRKDCFAASLFRCYELLQPDEILEIAWSHGALSVAVPYFVQALKDLMTRVDELSRVQQQSKEMATSSPRPALQQSPLPYYQMNTNYPSSPHLLPR